MAINAHDLGQAMLAAAAGGSASLSAAMKAYISSNGSPVAPALSFSLAPCAGAGWEALKLLAPPNAGIGESIISVAVFTELSSSTKTMPPPTGAIPATWNAGASVKGLNPSSSANDAWDKIGAAIKDYISPTIV